MEQESDKRDLQQEKSYNSSQQSSNEQSENNSAYKPYFESQQ